MRLKLNKKYAITQKSGKNEAVSISTLYVNIVKERQRLPDRVNHQTWKKAAGNIKFCIHP